MSDTILDKIKAYKLKEIAADKVQKPLFYIEQEAKNMSPPRGFYKKLLQASKKVYGLIGEIKKASNQNFWLKSMKQVEQHVYQS